ncbi:MAG: chemotaxis protein CheX [Polyangiaceae bacterium]|nr:chemotaxis protein CheX [Polyangiaceae bacterium]
MKNCSVDAATISAVAVDVLATFMSESVSAQSLPARPPGVTWEARVGLTGSVTGELVIRCSEAFARRAAAQMLGTEAESDEVAQDALSELSNVVAGNVKGALFADCALTTPTVTTQPHGAAPDPSVSVALACGADRVDVALFLTAGLGTR